MPTLPSNSQLPPLSRTGTQLLSGCLSVRPWAHPAYLKDAAEAENQGAVLRAHEQVAKGRGGCATGWGLRGRGGGQCACRLSRHDMRRMTTGAIQLQGQPPRAEVGEAAGEVCGLDELPRVLQRQDERSPSSPQGTVR